VLSALSIDYSLTPIGEDGQTWVEREVVSAVYLDHEEVLVTDERQVTGDDTWSYSITTECG
jgi:hypothetical protein